MPRRELEGIKVLIVTSGHDVTDSRVYARHARGVRQLGADVTLVGKQEFHGAADVEILEVERPASRLLRFVWQPWRCLWRARRVSPDIIHFHDAELLLTLPLARRWWPRAKFVYDVHEDFPTLILIRDWLPAWSKPRVGWLTRVGERRLASLADAVVGVTAPLTAKFRNATKIVAYNFVAREFFDRAKIASLPAGQREFDLVHLGTLSTSRALFLGDTIRLLHERRPRARSLVIGVSPDIERVLRPRLPEGCTLVGKTAYDEIPRLLGNAKVGVNVHPSLEPHLRVALPVKVCEYMASGCAVVSSTLPVLDDVLREARVDRRLLTLIDGGTPGDYAHAIDDWLTAIEHGADPGEQLRESAEKYLAWENELTKIADLYLRLVGRR